MKLKNTENTVALVVPLCVLSRVWSSVRIRGASGKFSSNIFDKSMKANMRFI